MTCEELYINRIENGIRSIRLGTKLAIDVNVGLWLKKLRPLNDGIHDDLLIKYTKVMKEYDKRKIKLLIKRKAA